MLSSPHSAMRQIAVLTLLTLAVSIAATAALLAASGFEVAPAMLALWRGSFGSGFAVASATLVRAVPLILAGLAVALAFRAGIWNIGAEGQLLVGAASAATIALVFRGLPGALLVPFALLAATVAGAKWAAIASLLRERYGVLEVISTIMLNFIALHLVGWLVRGPLQEPSGIYPQSPAVPAHAQLPLLIPGTRLHAGIAIAIVAGLALWWFLRATAAGFRMRAIGASPTAARMAGRVNVRATATQAFLTSGALAGLAGGAELLGVTFALYENLSPGYGYSAIAVALLARLDALAVIAAGIFFAGLESGALAMQRDAGVPAGLVSVVEAVLILVVLVAPRVGARLPRWQRPLPDEAAA